MTAKNTSRLQLNSISRNLAAQSKKSSYGGARSRSDSRRRRSIHKGEVQELDSQTRLFLQNLRNATRQIKDPNYMESIIQQRMNSISMQFPRQIHCSDLGAPKGVVVTSATKQQNVVDDQQDPVQVLVGEIIDTSCGSLDPTGENGLLGGTMEIARGMASGGIKPLISHAILGDGIEQMSRQVQAQTRDVSTSTTTNVSVQVNVNVPMDQLAQTSKYIAQSATKAVAAVISKGMQYISTAKALIGKMNGARNLLQASLQKALDMQVAKMMGKIMSMVKTAHGYTHPLFLAIFQMTWEQNQQWKPDWVKSQPPWMKPVKELVEYFDFIQKIMGGAIGEVCKTCDKMFDDVVNIANKISDMSISAQLEVKFPVPDLSVPLMSISKQLEDVMQKIMVIKEIVRQKAKLLLKKLKSMSAPELYINVPSDFLLIMEVLIEAQFIYANLHLVMDKILEFFINLMVQKFMELADGIISKVFKVIDDIAKILPPIKDLIQLLFAVPNNADLCVNIGLNIALPEMWNIIQPFIDMPFQCIGMISEACDAAADVAYAIPAP